MDNTKMKVLHIIKLDRDFISVLVSQSEKNEVAIVMTFFPL